MRHHDLLVAGEDLGQQLAGRAVAHQRSQRHADAHVGARLAGAVRSLAVAPAIGGHATGVTQMEERVERAVAGDDHRAAVTAVAARRSAARHVLLAPEGDTAVAATSSLDVERYLIDENHLGGAL